MRVPPHDAFTTALIIRLRTQTAVKTLAGPGNLIPNILVLSNVVSPLSLSPRGPLKVQLKLSLSYCKFHNSCAARADGRRSLTRKYHQAMYEVPNSRRVTPTTRSLTLVQAVNVIVDRMLRAAMVQGSPTRAYE